MRGRRVWLGLFTAAIVAQLVALYLPDPPSSGGIPGVDKVVHVAIFLAPALLGVLAGLPVSVLAPVLIAHAVISEVVQHTLLPGRGGDPWDAMADIVGIAAGLALGSALLLRLRSRRSPGQASGGASAARGGGPAER